MINVAWVKSYINSLKDVTAIMVSHDSGFLNDCCTHILQIEVRLPSPSSPHNNISFNILCTLLFLLQRLKLRQFRGNLNKFIEQNPQAVAYFNMRETKLKFKFPQPGPIEGVKSRSKALMKMSHCDFTYPGSISG